MADEQQQCQVCKELTERLETTLQVVAEEFVAAMQTEDETTRGATTHGEQLFVALLFQHGVASELKETAKTNVPPYLDELIDFSCDAARNFYINMRPEQKKVVERVARLAPARILREAVKRRFRMAETLYAISSILSEMCSCAKRDAESAKPSNPPKAFVEFIDELRKAETRYADLLLAGISDDAHCRPPFNGGTTK